jgi:hypothetical protein
MVDRSPGNRSTRRYVLCALPIGFLERRRSGRGSKVWRVVWSTAKPVRMSDRRSGRAAKLVDAGQALLATVLTFGGEGDDGDLDVIGQIAMPIMSAGSWPTVTWTDGSIVPAKAETNASMPRKRGMVCSATLSLAGRALCRISN